jgi:excisionase family DNA binding protein
MNSETLLSVKQVAEYLQLNQTTIYAWAQQGKLPAIKVGRSWRFRRKDLEAWLDENMHGNQKGEDVHP